MTINERFAEILRLKNLSIKEASELTGLKEGYLRKLSTPDQSFGIEPLKTIMSSFPDINSNWLLTGNGEPLLISINEKHQGVNPEISILKDSSCEGPVTVSQLMKVIESMADSNNRQTAANEEQALANRKQAEANLKQAESNERYSRIIENLTNSNSPNTSLFKKDTYNK